MATLSEHDFLEIVTNHHPNSFSIGVERLAREYDIGYTEAVIAYCDKHEIEMDESSILNSLICFFASRVRIS